MKFLKDFELKGKRALVRCDFNVPLSPKGEILDDFRIKETIPTIEYLIKKGAKLLLMSHLGRPAQNQKYSLKPIAPRLEELLGKPVKFLADCIGEKVEKEIKKMKRGDTILLENLRFHRKEEENDEGFTKKLVKLGDIYINDAFSASHRGHASIVGIPKYLPSGEGLLLEKEIKILSKVMHNPWRPLIVIIGGVKIDTKIGVISQFLKKADHLLLGGEVANTILIGKGLSLGKSLAGDKGIVKKGEEDKSSSSATESRLRDEGGKESEALFDFAAARAIEEINITNPKLHLPVDGFISLEKRQEDYFREGAIGTIKKEEKIFDIGPETIKIFSEIIKEAKMILWSGPLGLFEEKKFEKGTKKTAENIVKNKSAFKIIGGGDTIAAVDKFGLLDRFDHVSTGGGAMLEFLSGEKLPGIEALK